MIDTLKAMLGLSPDAPSDNVRLASEDLPLATATLLVEMTRADHTQTDEEREVVQAALASHFSMPAAQARDLLDEAERETARAISLRDYTSALNHALDDGQRIQMLELLWRVALADGHLDKYEEYLVRKVADLLYVPHAGYIKAKLAVMDGEN